MKIQKVLVDGIHMYDLYPHATSWQVFKYKFFWKPINTAYLFLKKVCEYGWKMTKLATLVVVAMIVGAFVFGNFVGASTLIVNAGSSDLFPVKIEQLKDELVDSIANLENVTNIPIVIDDNKTGTLPKKDKVSIGCMQFKIGTIEHYYNVLKKGSISDSDAVMLALDCTKAKALGKEIIFETDGGLWNWSVATKEMGTRVTIIKELGK